MQEIDLNHIFKTIVSASIWAFALAVGAYDISVAMGIFGAFLGGFIGFVLGGPLAKTRLRTWTILAIGAIGYPILRWICTIPVRSAFAATLLGSESAYTLSDASLWFLGSILLVSVLHACTVRRSWFLALEVAVIASCLISPMAGHRDGFINRPYYFVDPLWSGGHDPVTWLFLPVGILVACTLLIMAVGRFNKRNTVIDLMILLFITLLIGIYLPLNKINQLIPQQENMGLQGQAREQGDPPPPQSDDQNKDKDKDKDQNQDQNKDQNQDQNEGGQGSSNNNEDENDENDSSPPPQPKPVAIVVFEDDYTPADGYYYFRQSAQSMFNGIRLVEDTTGKADTDIAAFFPGTDADESLVTPEPQNTEQSAKVHTDVSLIVSHTLPFGLIAPQKFTAKNNPDPSQFVRAYSVDSLIFKGQISDLLAANVGNPQWPEDLKAHYLKMPDDPRYKELADKILVDLPAQFTDMPVAKAAVMKLWLEKEGTYDNKVKIQDKDDVVAKFLFGDKIGYCVHFAHSMAYLCRAAGIPSRVATGYAAPAEYRYGGTALMLQDNSSHAWCEIYVEGLGWYPVDVSPQNCNCEPPTPPDADLQRMLGEMSRGESTNKDGKPQKNADLQIESQMVVKILGLCVAALIVLFILFAYVMKIFRRLSIYTGGLKVKLTTVFIAALDSLADVGVRREYGEAREDFATRVYDRFPALKALTAHHMKKALGESPVECTSQELMKHYKDLKKQIRSNFPWWRRLIGLINPISWLFVK